MIQAPPHWAAADAPLNTAAGPRPAAGGDGAAVPYTSKLAWEFDVVTSIKQVDGREAPPASRIHRGGCHCGAVRFEVEAHADPLVVYDCVSRDSLPLTPTL
eukprot:2816131-Prymnesium_polylepis.2